MVSLATSSSTQVKTNKSKFNDEFESYLKKQCLKTTFNGLEIETFSWYKKVLGISQFIEQIYKDLKAPNGNTFGAFGFFTKMRTSHYRRFKLNSVLNGKP